MFTHTEEKTIESELKTKKKKDRKITTRLIFMFTLAVLVYSPQLCNSAHYRWFPDTWICSKCGYDNYDGIHRCALCGTPKR